MKSLIYAIAIILTDKCTADCDICCFECSMEKNNRIDLDLALRIIDEAHKISSVKTLGLSGGEPFLFYEDMLTIIKHATQNGLRVTCTTNSYWAINDAVTNEKLKNLKQSGLKKLGLSVDCFHNAYVNIQNVKRVLEQCKALNIETEIGSVVTKDRTDIYSLFRKLGESMFGIKQQTVPCLPVGNALNRIDKSNFYYDKKVIGKGSKCHSLYSLAIMPNGDVYPCCSQAGVTVPLFLGNVNNLSIIELMKKYNSNMHIRLLRKEGLSWYLKHCSESSSKRIESNQYVSECHLCRAIMTDELVMQEVKPYIAQLEE